MLDKIKRKIELLRKNEDYRPVVSLLVYYMIGSFLFSLTERFLILSLGMIPLLILLLVSFPVYLRCYYFTLWQNIGLEIWCRYSLIFINMICGIILFSHSGLHRYALGFEIVPGIFAGLAISIICFFLFGFTKIILDYIDQNKDQNKGDGSR